ncbi:EamA family transporter, partial [Bacillus velezensis]
LAISWVWLGEVPAFIALTGGMVTVAGVCFTYLKANKIRLK